MYTLGSEPPGKAATSHVGLLVYFIVVPLLPAQVLVTAENGGRGSRSLMAAANLIQVPGFGVFSNNSLQYGQGITGRIDGFIGYGNIATHGQFQSYLAVGGNIGLLRRSHALLDVSLYHNATIALTHRQKACKVLLASALIASRPIPVQERRLTVYGGAMRQTPLGVMRYALFTAASPVYSAILGASWPITANAVLLFEYNPGRVQSSGGIGLLYTIPRHAAPPPDTGSSR